MVGQPAVYAWKLYTLLESRPGQAAAVNGAFHLESSILRFI